MEATELRIGNIVRSYYAVTDELLINNSSPKYIDRPIKSGHEIDSAVLFDPIPLTEEWLRKAGFVLHDNGLYKTGSFEILWDKFSKRPGCIYKSVKIYSVHHLQNIYYALTGEELI